MPKIISNTVKLFLMLIFNSNCSSQTETFDIATYTPPKDWKKTAGNGVVSYTNVNTTTGTFCVLAMYASTASLGDAQKDFKTEWQDLVVTLHNAEANPKTESQTSGDGWTVVSAAAPIKLEGNDAYSILTVFSGFGKKFSVKTTLNDQTYIEGVDALLKNIKLNKTATATVTQTNIPVATNSNGTKKQFGSVIYTIPKGWNVTKYPDGDILTPADFPKNEFLEIWVQPSMNFSGTMEEALQKSFDETVEKMKAAKMYEVNGGNYNKEAAKISFKGWEYIRCSGGIHLGDGEYPPEYSLDLFVIKVNGRFEKVSIVKSRNSCGYYSTYDIENFLFSLQFPDWKEPVVKMGTIKGDGVAGVWQGIAMSVGMSNSGAGLGAQYKVKQLIFFSNGQAFFGNNFPTKGLDELNTWIRAELNRRDWGTYTFSNGKGMVKLPYEDIPVRMENGKLIITPNKTDHGFIKINSVDGARFNGVYACSSKDFLGIETGKAYVISFTADGKFSDNGAIKFLYHGYVDCLNDAEAPGSGTYEVKNYSVIFNYTDGRKIKIAFLGTEYDKNNQSPATLRMSSNEDLMMRQ